MNNNLPTSSPFTPFKSKKIIRSTSKSSQSPSNEIQPLDPNTPGKEKTKSFAFTLNQVKKAAAKLNKSTNESPLPLNLTESSTPSAEKERKSGKKKMPRVLIKLPEKFELLAKFFDDMQSTYRLLKLKGTVRNFTNICPGVESLSDRRFSYEHLAQMKYVLPEAIELKRVNVVDERTCCTKSDIEVMLLIDAVECDGKGKIGSGYSNLSKVFRTRLLEFVKNQPEEREIPMGELPEPFNTRMQNSLWALKENCNPPVPVHSSSNSTPQQSTVAASHLSQSFKTRFSQKSSFPESEKTGMLSTTHKHLSHSEEARSSVATQSSKLQTIKNISLLEVSYVNLPTQRPVKPDDEETNHIKDKDYLLKEINPSEETPAKVVSTPARLMTTTPVLQTPKRCHTAPDDVCSPSPKKLVRRPLMFPTPVKNAKAEVEINETESPNNAYIMRLLPEAVRNSIMEKEKKATKEHDIAISQAKRRRQMIACLPKLFNMIHLMFQSNKGSIITKEELMHKLIRSHLDIVDRAELEEQLKLMKELVPDWIAEKTASSGDLLLSINKSSCPDLIRRRLTAAL
ncbi:hypothetical protein IFM89_017967 [Coptis chinensis]|uniref:CDT1 Geminin-binding domain-containing protein n=1 Tax=Coptis chinensis TaxID=261450 RepID=A0A835HUL7_9MAGN|nr:hypothetical protein IFM89_017967 [Coptis chinensis]